MLFLFNTMFSRFLTCRFMLLSRDLMLRKWILQVGSAPLSAFTSLAHQPMLLASKCLGSSKERVPCPVVCHVTFRPPSHASVQMCISPVTKDEEHSMCQDSTLVIFNITVFILITIIVPLSGLALCLGLFVCMLMIKTHPFPAHCGPAEPGAAEYQTPVASALSSV